MIYAYDPTETGVPTHMGRGALAPSACYVTEDINGAFELTMEHPIDASGKWGKITETCLIKAPTHRGNQMFRVCTKSVNSQTRRLTITARHKFYDLERNMLLDVRPTVKNGQDAGNIILAGCAGAHPFTFSSDITDISSAYYIRQNPVAALIGNIDQSFINRWGGEILRDNNSIAINMRIGADNGVRIAYGKQLSGLNLTVDMTSVYTRVIPTALNASGAVMLTDAIYYDSPLINNYPYPMYGTFDTGIHVGQAVDEVVAYPDEASAKTAMASMAQAMFANGCDVPTATLTVDFARWQDTEEYKQYAGLYTVGLGDDVIVYHKDLGVDVKMRVVQIKWDCLKNRAAQLVLGTKSTSITKSVVSMGIDVSALKTNAAAVISQGERYNGVTITNKDGFVTQATINGKTITVKQNSYDGLAIYDGATYKGGVAVVNGEVVMVSNTLTNDVNGDCYARVGNFVDGAITYKGVEIFLKSLSTTTPVARIYVSSTSGGRLLIKTKGGASIRMDDNFPLSVRDASGMERICLASNMLQVYDAVGEMRLSVTASDVTMFTPSGEHGIGVDDSGPYYIKNSEVTYL